MALFDRPRPGQPGYFEQPAGGRRPQRPQRQGGYDTYSDLGPGALGPGTPNGRSQQILGEADERYGLSTHPASIRPDYPTEVGRGWQPKRRPQGPSPMWGIGQPNPFQGNPMMQNINPSGYQQDVLNRAQERFGLEPRGASPYMDSPLQPEGMYYDDMDYEDPYATGGEYT